MEQYRIETHLHTNHTSKCGWLDAAALADAMERLMDRPEERQAMGRRARERYENSFTGEAFAKNTESIYLDILKGAK